MLDLSLSLAGPCLFIKSCILACLLFAVLISEGGHVSGCAKVSPMGLAVTMNWGIKAAELN